MKKRILSIALVLFLLSLAFMVVPGSVNAASARSEASHAAPAASTFTGIPVSGTATRAGQTIATFTGTLNVTKFVVQNGHLLALGNVSGTLANTTTGQTVNVSNVPVALPAAVPSATCQILNLVLGPLHLNLLGLVVDLNQVVLNITAQQAPGNLLGNLLCAITNLLNTSGPLSTLASQLNQVLSIVG